MQSNVNIENALKNIEQVEVPSSTYDKVDNVLKSLDKRENVTYMQPRFRKPTFVAAVIVISLLTFSTVALAYTGVLGGIFAAIAGGIGGEMDLGTDTRRAIVEHDHVVAEPQAIEADDGSILELNAYFVDEREIWFDFTLSYVDIPDGWNPDEHQVLPGLLSLTMTQSDGTELKWESIIDENLSEWWTYPGGYTYIDRVNDTHGSVFDENSHIFVSNNTATLNDDGSLDIVIIISFSYPHPPVGENIHLEVGNFLFSITQWDLFVEGVDNPEITQRIWLDSVWEFDIDVDSRFIDASALIYEVVDVEAAAQLGITIHSVTVTPTATRVEMSIDYSKNNLMNIDYFVLEEATHTLTDDDGVLRYVTQQDVLDTPYMFMHVLISVISDSGRQRPDGESRFAQNGDIVEGWTELASVYFDASEYITLVFETKALFGEFLGDDIHIPLRLVR